MHMHFLAPALVFFMGCAFEVSPIGSSVGGGFDSYTGSAGVGGWDSEPMLALDAGLHPGFIAAGVDARVDAESVEDVGPIIPVDAGDKGDDVGLGELDPLHDAGEVLDPVIDAGPALPAEWDTSPDCNVLRPFFCRGREGYGDLTTLRAPCTAHPAGPWTSAQGGNVYAYCDEPQTYWEAVAVCEGAGIEGLTLAVPLADGAREWFYSKAPDTFWLGPEQGYAPADDGRDDAFGDCNYATVL